MIDEETHPEMQAAARELALALTRFAGQRLSSQLMIDLNSILADHRAKWRARGVDFPVMCAMVVPRLQIIELKRADLDAVAIDARIVQFYREHPLATLSKNLRMRVRRSAACWRTPP